MKVEEEDYLRCMRIYIYSLSLQAGKLAAPEFGIGSDVFLMQEQIEIDDILDELLDYFIHVERQTLLLVQRGVKPRKVLLEAADRYLGESRDSQSYQGAYH